MATAKRLLQALTSLILPSKENAGPGYSEPEVRYFSARLSIEDRARWVS